MSFKIPIKHLGGYLWEDTPLPEGHRKRRWVSAKGLCERLSLLGVDGWSLANVSQFESLRAALVQRISRMNPDNLREGAPRETRPFLTGTTGYYGRGYWTIDGRAYLVYKGRIDTGQRADRSITYEQSEAQKNHSRAYWLPEYRCVNDRTYDLAGLYRQILAGLKVSAVDRSLPSAPTPPNVRLTKSEFEKTADFEARKAEAEARAAATHAKAVEHYRKTLERRQAEIARAEETAANSYQIRRDAYEKAFNIYYGAPHLSNVSYNADTETFSYQIVGNQVFRQTQKVPIAVAAKYKEIITAKDFKPTVMVSASNGTFTITGIKELVSPVDLVRQTELEEAYGSVDALHAFALKYPGTDLARKAQLRAAELREAEVRRQQAEEQRQRERAEAQRRAEEQERQAHMARKAVGDKVCMRVQMYLGLISPTLSGYVEAVNDDKIRIRVANTEGTTPHYNGVTLRQGVQIWDNYQSWKRCD